VAKKNTRNTQEGNENHTKNFQEKRGEHHWERTVTGREDGCPTENDSETSDLGRTE